MLTPPAEGPRPLEVVIVEDYAVLAEVLTMLVQSLGHRAHVAYSGREGIELVRSIDPDVVIADLLLPDIDGLAVGREIQRASSKTPTMIAMSGALTPCIERALRAAGFEHVFPKPLSVQTLSALLADVAARVIDRAQSSAA